MFRRFGLCAAVLISAVAPAQGVIREEWLKAQFGGWTGLSFYCEIAGNSTETSANICSWATQRVRILARQSGVPLIVVSSDPFRRTLDKRQGARNHLDLVLYIRTTVPTPGQVVAVYIAIRAAPHVSLPPDDKSPNGEPRSGTLVLWETDLIGSGSPGHELEGALQQAVETNLMKFLNDYTDGTKP